MEGKLPPKNIHVDHINNINNDNRWCNLRLTTYSQNLANAKRSIANTSGVKGVLWHKTHQKWTAKTSVNGKRHYLGYFSTIEEASKVINEFRKNNHGNFAR
jgi:hypothetical protein